MRTARSRARLLGHRVRTSAVLTPRLDGAPSLLHGQIPLVLGGGIAVEHGAQSYQIARSPRA